MPERSTPRVILRQPRRGLFNDVEVIVLEMGLGGAKFEHRARLPVKGTATFSCGPLTTSAAVRHSELVPAKDGNVYQTGVEFLEVGPAEQALLVDLLTYEAKEQIVEWEANCAGDGERVLAAQPRHRSAAAARFIALRHGAAGWTRTPTRDPNQPPDGVLVSDGTPEDEIATLCATYEACDDAGRELLRRVATVAILEQLRSE